MALITIKEDALDAQGRFQAQVSFNHGPDYLCTIHNPFTQEQEKELAWYFEEHLSFPFTEKVRADAAAQSIVAYGIELFTQVFADRDAYSEYKRYMLEGLEQLQIEIAGTPNFQALHWEALRDPELPRPLPLQAEMVRKNRHPASLQAQMRPSPTLNVLVVTARPGGKRDVGYRTISRPLVELLRQSDLPVQLDLLRPGSYEALDLRLQQVANEHGPGYYQAIHFDVHGALLSYAELSHEQPDSPLLFQKRFGRDDIAPYEGDRAYLFLEDLKRGGADPVEASELADLLKTHQIPVAILNACQSGMQIGASETSLGSRLMQAGIQVVLAMGYSVTVSAAELLMRTLYRELFARRELARAISMARRELYNQKQRRAHYNQFIDLEDWLLPVVYQNRPVQLALRPQTPEEARIMHERNASRYAPSQPRYGFWGRDLDILSIEKRLLTQRTILLVRGMGGAGKTTLLHHLGAWWQTTHFVDEVFYFGYDERAWTRLQLLSSIAHRLLSEVEYLTTFQPLSEPGKQSLLVAKLRARRHLLILDNLESITGSRFAIKHTLGKKEREALHSLLKELAGGQTLVLLGSRGGEEWLAAESFVDNIYDLPGLDDEAASGLSEQVLLRVGATKYQKDPHLRDLLKLLGGFPLAIEVVLANLARQTPVEVIKALHAGDVQLNVGDSQQRTENILRCIEYSHSNLSPDAQALLTCLAPFTSVVYKPLLNRYSEHLKAQPALAHLPFERWQEVLQEALNWGLLAPDPDIPDFLRLQPIFPYFLRTRLTHPQQAEQHQAIDAAFLALYDQFGREMYQLLNAKEPKERQLGLLFAQYEYENLLSAVRRALDTDHSILIPYSVLSDYFGRVQSPQQGLEVAQEVQSRLLASHTTQPQEQHKQQLAKVLDDLGFWHLQLKHLKEAEHFYQQKLQIDIELNRYPNQANAYHQLGRVAQEQRLWEQAQKYFQQALDIYAELNDRYKQASIYHNLGIVAQEQRLWEQAQQYFQQALQICVEFNDRYNQARIYHQLGIVAQEHRQWEQAQQYYQQALQLKVEFNNHYSQASTYHQLGAVAQEQQQWEQAQQYLQRALQIYVEFNDRSGQANIYNQLGIAAQEQGQSPQAREYLLQAMEIFLSFQNQYNSGIPLHNLALLWRASGDASLPAAVATVLQMSVEEAEALLRRALPEESGGTEGEQVQG